MIARTMTISTPTRTALTLRAPALKPVSEALWALHESPDDRSAAIVAALLHKEGIDRCPCCTTAFTTDGLSETRWSGGLVQRLTCGSCQASFVIDEQSCC